MRAEVCKQKLIPVVVFFADKINSSRLNLSERKKMMANNFSNFLIMVKEVKGVLSSN
jgi:hypothetical protein